MRGKWSFDLITSSLRKLYYSDDWWGLELIWEDWRGKRYLLKYVLGWWKKETGKDLPDWIFLEDD